MTWLLLIPYPYKYMAVALYTPPSWTSTMLSFIKERIIPNLPSWSHDLKELYEDVEHARMYRDSIKAFLKRARSVPCKTIIGDLERAIARLDVVLQPLVKGGFVRNKFNEQSSLIKRVMTEKVPFGSMIHRIASGFFDTTSKLKITSPDAGFGLVYPRWYREELAFHVNNVNIVVDKLLLYLNQPADTAACPLSEDVITYLIPEIRELPDEKTLTGFASKLWSWINEEGEEGEAAATAAAAAPPARRVRRDRTRGFDDLTPAQKVQKLKIYGEQTPQQQRQSWRRVMKGKIKDSRLARVSKLRDRDRLTPAQEAQYERLIARLYPQ